MTTLAEFTARLLNRRGALLEPIADGFEVILPSDAAGVLNIPEHTTLSFAEPRPDGVWVSHTSEVFERMGGLVGDRGALLRDAHTAFSVVNIPTPSVNLDRLEHRLAEKVIFTNAVFHVDRRETRPLSYLAIYARYTARSDQRQDGVIALLINELNLAVRRIGVEDVELLMAAEDGPLEGAARQGLDVVLPAAERAQREIATRDLSDFVRSLERRLNRDVHRVHEYYESLMRESRRSLAKKSSPTNDQGNARGKITAIETELKWKVQDLIAKYALRVEIDPIAFVRIEAPVPIFWISIKRRKSVRSFPLTYNPLFKTLDSLPCESCYHSQSASTVCDDRLDLVCKACGAACPTCEKEFCRVCCPSGCPRCRTRATGRAMIP